MGTVNMVQAEIAFESFMKNIGLDTNSPHLKDTAKRVVKMYCREVFAGLHEDLPEITSFDSFAGQDKQLIIIGPIELKSTCAHHFMPIVGHVVIGILMPNDAPLIGLSKFNRIVRHFARRPQVQEKLLSQIVQFLKKKLKLPNVAITIKAKHFCNSFRGVEDPCSLMLNQQLEGLMREMPLRQEYSDLAREAFRNV